MMKFYVYQHVKADTNAIFYVGKGKGKRCNKKNGRNQYWHNVVNKHGYKAEIVVDGLDEELAFLTEIELIDKYKKLGLELVNTTDGGEGASGYKHTEEHKEKLKGNEYWKLVKVNGFKGKTHSDEQKAKWSEMRKGSPGTRNGVHLSDETKAKMSASKSGKPVLAKRVLSDDQVREIRFLLQTEYIAEIARRFNVGESTIRRIRDGERYGDVK